MIGISFVRILRAALQNLGRNVWLSVATTMIMTITLIMMTFLYFANVLGGEIIKNIQQQVDISVTFKENVQEQYIQAISEELRARQDVQSVRVITSAEALQTFKSRHQDDPLIEESLKELENNPLPASIYIVATEPRFYQNIDQHLKSEKYTPFIEQVNFERSRSVIDRLISVIGSVKNVGLIVTLIFAVLATLIMFNTVRLAIYSFREEIDIMRLVGASRWFIQGPFVFETMVVALVSVGLCTALVYPFLHTIAAPVQRFFFTSQDNQFNIYTYAVTHWFTIIGLQAATAVGLAIISSWIAVRRYLRD